MNKVSVLLISGICILMGIGALTLHGIIEQFGWQEKGFEMTAAATVAEEMALSNIAMNDEAQVINGGSQDMWIRAKVEIPQIEGKEAFELVSSHIAEKQEGKKPVWILDEDGYYYYSERVKPGEQSDSLFFKVKPLLEDKAVMPHEDSVNVVAEAIQINWIEKEAKDAREAFAFFDQYGPVQERKVVGHAV